MGQNGTSIGSDLGGNGQPDFGASANFNNTNSGAGSIADVGGSGQSTSGGSTNVGGQGGNSGSFEPSPAPIGSMPGGATSNNAPPSSGTGSNTGTTPSTPTSGNSDMTSDDQQALQLQNTARAEVGENPLVWNATLVAIAASWTAQLKSENCAFKHSGHAGVGENIAQGTSNIADAVQLFLNEKAKYVEIKERFKSNTINCKD